MESSTAEDLGEADRRWAEAIAGLTGISLAEAEKRARRIRYDTKIQSKLREVAAELGPTVVITNIEWSGPTMEDITVTTTPAPVGAPTTSELAAAMGSRGKTAHRALKELTEAELKARELQARTEMRFRVAAFELQRVFGPPRTTLVSLVHHGFLNDLVDVDWEKVNALGFAKRVYPGGPTAPPEAP
jgi:hypothetical protein